MQLEGWSIKKTCIYPEFVKLQCLRDKDELLHLSHLPYLSVTLINNLGKKRKENMMDYFMMSFQPKKSTVLDIFGG